MFKSVSNKILQDVLTKHGVTNIAEIAGHFSSAQSQRRDLYSYFVENAIIPESVIAQALSKEFKLDIVDLRKTDIAPHVIERVPIKIASFYEFMPVELRGNELTIAVYLPGDLRMEDDIRVNLGLIPKFVLAPKFQIQEALKKYYGFASDTIERILNKDPQQLAVEHTNAWVEDIEKKSEDPSVSKLVNQIILEAYQKRATDIHLEPYRDKIRLRYRIDGVLVDANLPPEAKHFLLPMLSRIKIMSNLSITERRLPQDGSAVVRTNDQDLDLRISTIPTPRGESMVIRILPTKSMRSNLESLGLNPYNAAKFRSLISQPHGIIFVTGPTGSGKTTTLYACLHELNRDAHKIITIEDPIEYEMEGITQIQVNPKINFSFADGLRSILRHDPDIIMVGEVRDLETAEIAIRTALTGHLVFSTLHTNDAPSGITRLIDMGLEPYLIASSVEAFVAQRLVRLICPKCKQEDTSVPSEIKREIREMLNLPTDNFVTYKGAGCDHCNRTGYFGRTAIYEIFEMSPQVRGILNAKPKLEQLRGIGVQNGMMSLRQNGWQSVIEGKTTVSEVINVTIKSSLSTTVSSAETVTAF